MSSFDQLGYIFAHGSEPINQFYPWLGLMTTIRYQINDKPGANAVLQPLALMIHPPTCKSRETELQMGPEE